MASSLERDIPQWKKDLIARLRNQNKFNAIESLTVGKQQLSVGPSQSQSTASFVRAGQQPNPTCSSQSQTVLAETPRALAAFGQCNSHKTGSNKVKMVQECLWIDNKDAFEMVSDSYNNGNFYASSDSDSSEELHYGPGIVNKLKNKYLSLASRESNVRSRPSILKLRKTASLENLLDDDLPKESENGPNDRFQSRLNGNIQRNVPNRYRNATRGCDMKRARSVETISRGDLTASEVKTKRESMHEEILIVKEEGNDKSYRKSRDKKTSKANTNSVELNCVGHRISRPKKIAPIMNEREKPPADFVKQAKMLFEKPDQRTRPPHSTGEVAAKVNTFKSIIGETKNKKPPIKTKPNGITKSKYQAPRTIFRSKVDDKISQLGERNERPKELEVKKLPKLSPMASPIPDVSRTNFNEFEIDGVKSSSLSETPDLIVTSSLIPVSSPTFRIAATENFIREEINFANCAQSRIFETPTKEQHYSRNEETKPEGGEYFKRHVKARAPLPPPLKLDVNGITEKHPFQISPPSDASSPLIRDFEAKNSLQNSPVSSRIPSPILRNQENVNASEKTVAMYSERPVVVPEKISSEKSVTTSKLNLTEREIQKNLINTAKTLQQPKRNEESAVKSEDVVNIFQVPKVKKPPREPESNSIVFKFTDRKDVPDYVGNDRSRPMGKLERPKVGEGGIILLPGASIDESFTDEDEEILRYLEAPPSPCDVTFINDNILIDGKSSLSQKSKKPKMKISFVDSGPEVYEYPSESSFLLEEVSILPINPQVGHTVPLLSGSTLANYTPKSTEEFELGVTRTISNVVSKPETNEETTNEIEEPITFSAGANSDILF